MNQPVFEKIPPLTRANPDRVLFEMPRHKCFCCEDTGLILSPELILENHGRNDVPLVCKRPGCWIATQRFGQDPSPEECRERGIDASKHVKTLSRLDHRATAEQCQVIHDWNRSEWARSCQNWHERRSQGYANQIAQAVADLAGSKSFPDDSEIEF